MIKIFLLMLSLSELAFSYSAAITYIGYVPGNIEPGKSISITVKATNTGVEPWFYGSGFYICSSHNWDNTTWGVAKKRIPSTILSGGSVTLTFNVTAPTTPGQYNLDWGISGYDVLGSYFHFSPVLNKSVSVRCLPSQFIAKLYTEALGRAPDQVGWNSFLQSFRDNGCNLTSLVAAATSIFTSSEYNGIGYDNQEKVITLYRALLCREPDPSGFSYWLGRLSSGTAMSTVVYDLMTDNGAMEFINLQGQIFNGGSYGWRGAQIPNISLTLPPVSPRARVTIFSGTSGAALQTVLNNTLAGDTVVLPKKLVVIANSSIIIPNGVTLKTDSPNSNPLTKYQYVRFARIVRSLTNIPTAQFTNLVTLNSGARLEHVFVDGSRSALPILLPWSCANISLAGGTNTIVNECRSSNSGSGTQLHLGDGPGGVVNNVVVSNNLVTGYESSNTITDHWTGNATTGTAPWADGITCACTNARILNNYVVDATDVSIIVFGIPGFVQRTQVSGNIIVNAGNSANSSLSAEAGTGGQGCGCIVDMTGCRIENNTVLAGSGPHTHYAILFSINTRFWFGDDTPVQRGLFFGNNVAWGVINTNVGILASDLDNNTVTGNVFTTNLINTGWLPPHRIVEHTTFITNTTIQSDVDKFQTIDASLINGLIHQPKPIGYKKHVAQVADTLSMVGMKLFQNSPNPFNPSTMIGFQLPLIKRTAGISLRVFDLQGRLVRSLHDWKNDGGRFQSFWNGRSDAGELVQSGVYFCTLTVGSFTRTIKMIMLK